MAIDKLPSGKWRVRVQAGRRPDGKPRRVTRTFPASMSFADVAQAERIVELEVGATSGDGDELTLADAVRLNLARQDGVKALTTQHNDRGVARRWLNDSDLGRMPLSKIRTPDVERHYQQILNTSGERVPGKVGPPTVRQLDVIVSQAFKWAVRMGWIASNPAADCSPIPTSKSKIRATDPAAYRRAVAIGDDIAPGLSAYILFLGGTGCRKSEALALRWSDVNGSNVTIDASIAYVPQIGHFEKTTKTHQSRTVTIGAKLTAALDELREVRRENLDGQPFDYDSYVWSVDGLGERPWRPDTAGKWARKAGVSPLELRHMNATQLLAAGERVHVVAQRLGHASPKMTMDVYAEAIPNNDQTAADIMDDLG